VNVTAGKVTLINDTLNSNNAKGGTGGNGGIGGNPTTGSAGSHHGGIGGNGGGGGNGTGGGLYIVSGSTTILANTLIAQNTETAGTGGTGAQGRTSSDGKFTAPNGAQGSVGSASDPDVSGTVASSDHDLIGDGTGSNLTNGSNGDQVGTASSPINPLLGALGNNGGPTQTIALLPGSPSIDAGDSSLIPIDPSTAMPYAFDQRGLGFNRVVGGNVDIGAYEAQGFVLTVSGGSNQSTGANTAFANPLVVTVTAQDGVDPVAGGRLTFTTPSSGASATLSPANPVTIASDGTATVTATANGAVGSYSVGANTAGVATPVAFTLTNQAPTSISVSASSTAPVYGQSVTLTATVTTPAGDPIPTFSDGTVTFYDGGTWLGTANLSGSPATATLTTTALVAGSHTITAAYSGDNNFVASQSGVEPTSAEPTVPAILLNFPKSVAVDRAGDVFIADTGNNLVEEVTPNGTPLLIGSFYQPNAVTVDGQGDLFFTDGYGQLWEMPFNGAPTLIGLGPLPSPGVAKDSQGDTFLADPANNRVLETKADSSQATVGTGLNQPYGVAVDAAGDVFIADSGNNRVVEVKVGLPVTVSPATPTVSVSDAGGTYNGNAFAATDSVAGVVAGVDTTPVSSLEGVTPTLTYYQGTYTTLAALNTALASGLTGSNTSPNVAGSYTVVASFAGSTDYSSGQALATFTIAQATPTVSVSDAGGTYNGNAFAATDSVAGVVTGVDNTAASALEGVAPTLTYYTGTYTLANLSASGGSSTAPKAAGSYTVVASFAGSTDYSSGQALANFTIGQAKPTVSVSDAGGTYNQKPFAATATVAGVNGIAGTSLEGVTPSLTYYSGSTASGTPLAGAPTLPGTYTVKASFAGSADYTSASATTTFTIQTPTSITGPTIGVPGQPLTYTFAVNGPTQGMAFTINYGDGTTLTTAAGGPSIRLDHLYHATGSFTIQVTAKDQNAVVSQLATQSVNVSTVAMEADPSGGTDLAVGGKAAGGDTILVSATNTSGTTVSVTFDKAAMGTFTPTGHILVYGQGGKDTITLQPYVVGKTTYYLHVPALLYGEGTGGDHISAAGSAANNVLTGHGSNEVLTGGQGRDMLIAGTGAATLTAGVGDDILIGGSTSYDIGSNSGMTYDKQLASLYAIMAEWGSADSYATRLSALAGQLNTSTVHDNYASGKPVADQLLGNALANDWFFAGVNDVVKGKSKIAGVTSIT
jgi:hypothetical protein